MKKVLFSIIAVFMTVSLVNAQFSVMLVDDDANGDDNSASLVTALTNWGGVFTFTNITDDGVPTFDDMSGYDMVIWDCGNDGLEINLWDVSDTAGVGYTAVKYNAALIEYANAGGIVWVDAMDAMYDVCPGTPSAFSAGDFVYDVLGIAEYTSQAYGDDGNLGVSEAVISSTNTITTSTPFSWEWSTLWYGDGLTPTDEATSLYEMGGDASYPLLGQSMMLYKDNYIFSAMRVQRFGTQTMIDNLVSEMITAADDGNFPTTTNEVSNTQINIYPNPATDYISINEINNAEVQISDISGRTVISQNINGNTTINVSNLSTGVYNVSIISNEGVSSQKLIIK